MKIFGFGYCSIFVCIWYLVSNYGLIRLKRFILSFTAKLCNWFFSLTTFNASYICLKIWCDGKSWKILGTKHDLSHSANEIVICWLDCKWDRHLLAGSSHFYCFPRYIQGVVFADHSYKHRSYFIWRCALLGLELSPANGLESAPYPTPPKINIFRYPTPPNPIS